MNRILTESPGPALLLLGALAAVQPAVAQVALVVDDFLQLPASAGSPPLARINLLREVPDGSRRLFVNDLRGPLHVIHGGGVQTYVDLSLVFPDFRTSPGLSAGFVSFAFDPEFATSGLFYTVHTADVGSTPPNLGPPLVSSITQHSVLTEWNAVDPAADSFAGSRRELIRMASPHWFHGMQEIAFDPYAEPADANYRLLYIGNGDNGAVHVGEAQQLQRLDGAWGAMLRIDPLGGPFTRGSTTYDYGIPPDNPFVDGDPDSLDEIYAYGFRNLHRLAWDPATGHLFGSDIGEDNFEEINLILPGRNYGWPLREGIMALDPLAPGSVFPLPPDDATAGFTYPVAVYDHGSGRAIAGGFPYRGTGVQSLIGKFLFGDIVDGQLFVAEIAELEAADDGDPATLAPVASVDLLYGGQPSTLLQVVRDALSDQSVNRTDLRLARNGVGELFITTKQDAWLRRVLGGSGGGPGRTPATLTVERLGSGELRLRWDPGVCPGATDHAIFEGSIGDWESHRSVVCSDTGGDFEETFSPDTGSRYYLIAPIDGAHEGSYGLDSQGAERPPASNDGCRERQQFGCL